MEDFVNIEQYISNDASKKIIKKNRNPFGGIVFLLAGIFLAVLSIKVTMNDALKMTLLTIGVFFIIIGGALIIICFSKDSGYYVYTPTKSRMKSYKRYININDKQRCHDGFSSSDISVLEKIKPEVSTSTMVNILLSKDNACALVQLEEYIPHEFLPTTAVLMLTATDVSKVAAFVNKQY